MEKISLTKLDPEHLIVQGSEFVVEDRVTGKVFVSSKGYIDKLFREMGYRNLNVIKILEEFAGKVISAVGDLNASSIYSDPLNDTFVVTSETAVNWVKDMFTAFDANGFKVVRESTSDEFHIWDEFIIKTDTTYYCVYIDLLDEYAQVFSFNIEDKIIKGAVNEGKYKFADEDSLVNLMTLMSNPVDVTPLFDEDIELSLYEYFDLLSTLGYVRKKKKNYILTEEGEDWISSGDPASSNLENQIDEINDLTWLQRHVRSSAVNFKEACRIISYGPKTRLWDLRDFFLGNEKETSDMVALNS